MYGKKGKKVILENNSNFSKQLRKYAFFLVMCSWICIAFCGFSLVFILFLSGVVVGFEFGVCLLVCLVPLRRSLGYLIFVICCVFLWVFWRLENFDMFVVFLFFLW